MLASLAQMKQGRDLKKKLVSALQATKERITSMLEELRKHALNLSQLSNKVIAKLNHQAYKAINKPALKKMLDKRSTQSQNLYLQQEKQVKMLVKGMNVKDINKRNKDLIDSIGDCPLTCMDATELMADYDCMSICLNVQRPEAAIADPSRLVINDVHPTFVSSDNFLKLAR